MATQTKDRTVYYDEFGGVGFAALIKDGFVEGPEGRDVTAWYRVSHVGWGDEKAALEAFENSSPELNVWFHGKSFANAMDAGTPADAIKLLKPKSADAEGLRVRVVFIPNHACPIRHPKPKTDD
jgi:hypothetical protein